MAEKKSKFLFILCIIAVTILLSYIIYMLSLNIGVSRSIARLRAAGHPVSTEEYFEQRASSAEAVQNALELRKAIERIHDVNTKMDREIWDRFGRDTRRQLRDSFKWGDPEAVEFFGAYVTDNYELLLEARAILKRPELIYPPSTISLTNFFGRYSHIDKASLFQNVALQYFAHTGRYDEAFLIAEDMLRHSKSLDKTLLFFNRSIIINILIEKAENALMIWEDLSAEELELLRNMLIRAEDVLKEHNHSIYELLCIFEFMQTPEYRSWHRLYSGVLHLQTMHFIDYCERLMNIENASIHDRMDLIEDFKSEIKDRPFFMYLYEPYGLNATITIFRLTWDIDSHARLRNARTAIAAELFRRTNGRWPENLEELVPVYLDEIPIDPYDGSPLRYRHMREGEEFRAEDSGIVARNGVIIYSIGPEGTDEGGAISPHVNFIRGRSRAIGHDIVFPLGDIERIEK